MIYSDLAMARRIEAAEAANSVECARAGHHPQAASQMIGSGCAVFAGAGSPLTHAIGLGMRGPVTEVEIEALEDFYCMRGSPVSIDLCPLADPSLIEALARRGYRPVEFNTVLVRRIQYFEPLPPAGPRISVCQAGPAEMDIWVTTVGRGFFERDELTPEEVNVGNTIFHMPGARCYLAFTAPGEAAGAAALAPQQGVATMFADSTLLRARRRGVHTNLIRHRLEIVAAEGHCDLATASTLPGSPSQRNYERMGFSVAYTRAILLRSWG